MRYTAFLLLLASLSANAATLEVSVAEGNQKPQKYTYTLNGERQRLDLRESHRYNVAFQDKASRKEICREAEYRTGLVVALRDVEKVGETQYKMEVIGQLTNLDGIVNGEAISCGVNQSPSLSNRAFSDTSVLEVNKTKVLVVDRTTTLLLTIKD